MPINRIEPLFVVRSNIKTPAELKGKKVTISRFGSGSDIITRVALRYWKLDPEKDVSFFQSGNTPTRVAALIAGHMDAALVSSTGSGQDRRHRLLPGARRFDRAATGVCQLRRGGIGRAAQKPARPSQTIFAGADRRHPCIQNKIGVARAVLRESTSDAEAVGPLYERLSKSFRDFPTPEPRGIQNVIDALPTPKAKGAKAEDSSMRR